MHLCIFDLLVRRQIRQDTNERGQLKQRNHCWRLYDIDYVNIRSEKQRDD